MQPAFDTKRVTAFAALDRPIARAPGNSVQLRLNVDRHLRPDGLHQRVVTEPRSEWFRNSIDGGFHRDCAIHRYQEFAMQLVQSDSTSISAPSYKQSLDSTFPSHIHLLDIVISVMDRPYTRRRSELPVTPWSSGRRS